MTLRPVAYASRSLLSAESRYATIEKECLAISWACDHFQQYLIGKQFTVHTDHRPMLAILQSKRLDELSPRLQRFKLRLLRFSFIVVYVPGREQTVPDAMSRAPINSTGDSSVSFLIQEVDSYCLGMINSLPISDIQLEKLRGEQHSDEVLNNIIGLLLFGVASKASS